MFSADEIYPDEITSGPLCRHDIPEQDEDLEADMDEESRESETQQ